MVAIIILFALWALELGIILAKHGQPMTGKYNFWSALLTTTFQVGLLWWAGVFEVFK